MKLLFIQVFIVVFLCSTWIQARDEDDVKRRPKDPDLLKQFKADAEMRRYEDMSAKCVCNNHKQPQAFHDCLAVCQRIMPYHMKNNVNPHEVTRKKLYGTPKFTQEIRMKMCQTERSREGYVEELKFQVGEYKLSASFDYSTEEKVHEFWMSKWRCYKKCCKKYDEWN